MSLVETESLPLTISSKCIIKKGDELLTSPTSDGSVSFNVPVGENYIGTHDILIFAEAT